MKLILFIGLAVSALSAHAVKYEAKEIPNFSDGSTIECYAASVNNKDEITTKNMDVFYRIERSGQEMAYFRKVEKIGDYTFEGSCSQKVCELGIRDARTNTYSGMNATYAELNDNSLQIQVSSFSEGVKLTMHCKLNK